MLKKITNTIYTVLFLAIAVSALAVFLSSFNTPLKVRLFAVTSGSMEPKLPLGSVVIVKPQDNYSEGDIITAKIDNKKTTITHRIVAVKEDENTKKISYQTKGDANEDPDVNLSPKRKVIGKVIFDIPYLGYLTSFAQTQTGLIILIVIPSTLIVYSELLNIKTELKKIFGSKKDKPIKK